MSRDAAKSRSYAAYRGQFPEMLDAEVAAMLFDKVRLQQAKIAGLETERSDRELLIEADLYAAGQLVRKLRGQLIELQESMRRRRVTDLASVSHACCGARSWAPSVAQEAQR